MKPGATPHRGYLLEDSVTRPSDTGDGRRWDKRRHVVGIERQTVAKELVERYSEGASIRTLAVSIGRSYGFVHRVLTETGVVMRKRGGPATPNPTHEQR